MQPEHLLEERALIEVLLSEGRVELVDLVTHLLLEVADHPGGVLLEAVHPALADPVLELFLLAPQHLIREEGVFGGVEGLAKDVLLDYPLLVEVGELETGADFIHD